LVFKCQLFSLNSFATMKMNDAALYALLVFNKKNKNSRDCFFCLLLTKFSSPCIFIHVIIVSCMHEGKHDSSIMPNDRYSNCVFQLLV